MGPTKRNTGTGNGLRDNYLRNALLLIRYRSVHPITCTKVPIAPKSSTVPEGESNV